MAPSDTSGKRTVFVADDDDVARTLLTEMLRTAGLEVVGTAVDGRQAVAEINRLKPQVACLDIEMPQLSGLDVLARLRAAHPGMVTFMVTASPTAQNVREAIHVRADGVIAKPFSQDKIMSEINRAMARKQLKK